MRNWLKEYPELKYSVKDLGDFFRIELIESQVNAPVSDTVNAPVSDTVSDTVVKLLTNIDENIFSPSDMRKKMGLKHRTFFLLNYIQPALKLGLIEMTIPDKPNSRLQKYQLTKKGKELKKEISSR